MIIFTWLSTARGGAEHSIRCAADAISREGAAAQAVELRHGDAVYSEQYSSQALLATTLPGYQKLIADSLAGAPVGERFIVSNHRTWLLDHAIAKATRARLFVVYRATPLAGAAIRTLDAAGQLVSAAWGSMETPPSDVTPVFPCNHSKAAMAKIAAPHPCSVVIPNPIGDSWFQETPRGNEFQNTRLVSASRFVDWKRVVPLAEIMAGVLLSNEELHFDFYGEGPLRRELESIARRVPDGRFRVGQWQESLRGIYSSCLAYVSCSNIEAFGRVGAEAMACGLPLIVPSEGGLGEMVEESGVGRAFHAQNPAALSHAVRQWLSLPAMDRQAQRLRAREFARSRFHETVVARQWMALCR